jgi:alanyl-tRNA synthetase
MKDGNRYSPMDTYIVDTGYGLERWTWVSQGTPTVYEAVYPETIEFLKDNAGIELTAAEEELIHRAAKLSGYLDIDEISDLREARRDVAERLDVDPDYLTDLLRPLEEIYAIADHCRTLAYMFGDGIVPSNVGTGYLARMVLRRTKRLVDSVGVDAPLDDLVELQAERLGYENRDTIRDVVRTEERKYRETLDRGSRRVEQLAADYAERGEPIPVEELVELYDSHGIQPDMVRDIATERGATVAVPDDFYSLVAERHEGGGATTAAVERDERLEALPETEKLYYEDQERTEFEAVVLDVFDRGADGFDVVLDQTMFYPEGGGQPADHGTLATDDVTVEVTDVVEHDGVVLHRTDADPGKGEFVRGQLDVERRRRLMRHHTATHVVGHAARRVLGDHVRQAGAQKGVDRSRLDVTHYRRITPEEVERIERVANELVMANLPVRAEWVDRNEAQKRHGFDLYQGGVPPGERIRIVQVDDDVQACGGTHVRRTGDVGFVTVLDTEPVQDGVERLSFAAGEAAVEATQRVRRTLVEAAETLDVDPADVPATAARFFEEWKARGKTIDRLKTELAEARAAAGADQVDIDGVPAVIQRLDADADELRATANALVEEDTVAVLGSTAGGSAQFVVGVPDGVGINAGEVVGHLARTVGGGGGGPPDFAEGGGPDVDALDEALERAPDVLLQAKRA